jgi:hypothetical protein
MIPAACLMLEAGAAIAAIRSQLARLANIDPFHAALVYPKSFFINRLLSDTTLDPAPRRMPRSPPVFFLPLQHATSRATATEISRILEFLPGLG